jgi:hypothetical protein
MVETARLAGENGVFVQYLQDIFLGVGMMLAWRGSGEYDSIQ